jgi:Transglycosylase SLT domain/D-alanyl-D-alanine carboxypeptidase
MANLSEQALRQLAILGSRATGGRLTPSIIRAVIQQESHGDPGIVSPAGAVGEMQLMPGTAAGLGVKNSRDPRQNVIGGSRYLLAMLERFHNLPLALSAYNSGPGGSESRGIIEGNPETQAYVRNVMALEKGYRTLDQGASAGGGGTEFPTMGFGGPSGPGMPPTPPDPRMRAIQALNTAGQALQQATPSKTSLEILGRLGGTASAVTKRQTPIVLPHIPQPKGPAFQEAMKIPGAQDNVPQYPVNSNTVGGLNMNFHSRLDQLIKAVRAAGGKIWVTSGARDPIEQAKLYQAALAKYGNEKEARKHVAPPGKSMHDTHAGLKHGIGDGALAVDLGGDLKLAHELAVKFGLYFPMDYEPWHIQLPGV